MNFKKIGEKRGKKKQTVIKATPSLFMIHVPSQMKEDVVVLLMQR
jgi:hypothetical protein